MMKRDCMLFIRPNVDGGVAVRLAGLPPRRASSKVRFLVAERKPCVRLCTLEGVEA